MHCPLIEPFWLLTPGFFLASDFRVSPPCLDSSPSNGTIAKPAWPSTQVGRGAVVACATRASTGTPLAPYIGTWRGRILAPGSDSALTTWTWVQRADSSGVFTFAADTTSTPARLIALAPDSIVIELTRAIRRPGNPDSSTMRIVSSACGNDVEGYVIARLGTGGAQRLRFVGARATSR